jgi:hypothetical protein
MLLNNLDEEQYELSKRYLVITMNILLKEKQEAIKAKNK